MANNRFKIIHSEKVLDKNFLYFFLTQKRTYKSLNIGAGASAMPTINFGVISKVKIPILYLEEEQIVNILLSVDNEKEEYQKRKNKLGELKKGLM
ncbi:restriction endonuclease subunit S [Clostridium estertheticum]|uniref:restriction endonuclease subunit S n=1 Tax=Clostridium estertheticum TaxID=238834 RepID=UPI001C0E53E1|nr:restriction endonuclease subunit S [Clostridium estertheticum]MBU3198164.1 restriction endonuclease subunit S [Clostridium estertheticum]WAG67943.1 restriction endonuclease subunit S [Clostridium estertheticum]